MGVGAVRGGVENCGIQCDLNTNGPNHRRDGTKQGTRNYSSVQFSHFSMKTELFFSVLEI